MNPAAFVRVEESAAEPVWRSTLLPRDERYIPLKYISDRFAPVNENLVVPVPGSPTATRPVACTLKILNPFVCKSISFEAALLAMLVTLRKIEVGVPEVFHV